jgi:hypothetical protein
MQTVTQEEINKAARSRSLVLIDDIMLRVKVELIELETLHAELRDMGQRPTHSQTYELRLARLNLERLDKRVEYLGKRAMDAQKKKEENQARMNMYVAMARMKMPMHSAIERSKPVVDPAIPQHLLNGRIVTDDPKADESQEKLEAWAKAEIAAGRHPDFSKRNAELKAQEQLDVQDTLMATVTTTYDHREPDEIQDVNAALKPNNDGSIDL